MTKNADTIALTKRAYEASGHKTYEGFAREFGCGKRSLSGWMTGERRPDGMHQMVLGQIALGWHPGREEVFARAIGALRQLILSFSDPDISGRRKAVLMKAVHDEVVSAHQAAKAFYVERNQ